MASNLQRQSGPRDESTQTIALYFQDADTAFAGVDERTPPPQLPSGMCASAKNKRFRGGRATDRLGILICRWMKGDGTTPFEEIYDAAVYSNPTDLTEWILIAGDGGVWKTRPNNAATPVALPAGVVLDAGSVAMFVQCMNVLLLLRGPDYPPLVMESLAEGFKVIDQTPAAGEGDGTDPMPNSSFGAYVLNRLVVIQGKDFVACSDINDYTRYAAVTQTFQINQGDSDALLGLYLFNNATLVCLKTRSVYKVLNVSGSDLGAAQGPYNVTREFGLIAPRTAVTRGSNLYWMAQPGFVNMTLTELNQEQATTVTLSDSLPKTFGRVNPLYQAGMCAEIWNSRLYLALPLDEAIFQKPALTYTAPAGVITYALQVGRQYYFTPGADETLQVGTQTVSDPGPFIASAATATVQGLNSPSDYTGAVAPCVVGVNTGVAVYDFANTAPGSGVAGAWCGVDEAPGVLCVQRFLKLTWDGREHLLAVCADGWLREYEAGWAPLSAPGGCSEDEIVTASGEIGTQPIASDLVTRAFKCLDQDGKRFTCLTAVLATWDPCYTLSTITNGANSEADYRRRVSRDRSQYDLAERAPYDTSNINGDAAASGRQDYSVLCPDDTAGETLTLGSGLVLEQTQDTVDRLNIDERGFYLQARMQNARGSLELKLLYMETLRGDHEIGIHL